MFSFDTPSGTAAAAAALLCAAATAGPDTYFGLQHTAMGDATLGVDPAGRLMISNLGSSGEDGVEIHLGASAGVEVAIDPGSAGAWASGAMVKVKIMLTPVDSMAARFNESGGGQAALALDLEGASPSCVHVELRNGDVVVDERVFVPPLPAALVSGGFGSSPSPASEPMRVSARTLDGTHAELLVVQPAPGPFMLTGSNGAVIADAVRFTFQGLPPGEPVIGTRIVGSNVPGGTITVSKEWIAYKGWDGKVMGSIAAEGGAHISGVVANDLCAGCLECCEPPGDPSAAASGVIVSNIGSSGQDGVTFKKGGNEQAAIAALRTLSSPIDLDDDGDALTLSATGTFTGVSGLDLGECRIQNNALLGAYDLYADYSPIGSAAVVIEVYSGGVFQGSVLTLGGPFVVIGNLLAPGGLATTGCGKLGGVGTPPCFFLTTQSPFTFVGLGGEAFMGDDLRVLAGGPAGSIDDLESFTIRGAGLDPFTAAVASEPGGAGYVGGGLVHRTLGQASIAIGDVSGDGVPDIVVANIGSSGQDGVTTDLGRSEGGVYEGTFDMSSFSELTFDVYDDQCPMCPGGLVAGLVFEPTGPATTELTVRRDQCCCCNVTLVKLTGEPAGDFDMFDGPLTIETAAGADLRVTRLRGQATRFDPLVLDLGLRCSLEQDPPNPASSGVTVSHPVHGTFTEVSEIIITSSEVGSEIGTIDRACLVAAASPACDPCSFTITRSGLVQHGHVHESLGEARLVADECEEDDDDGDGTLWADNLGSSGQDGVRIDLRGNLCNEVDVDCDGRDDEVVSGATALLRWESWSWGDTLSHPAVLRGAEDGGELQALTYSSIDKAGPGSYRALCAAGLFSSPTVTVTVRDEYGNAVASVSDLPPGEVALVLSDAAPGEVTIKVVDGTPPGAGPAQQGADRFLYHVWRWPVAIVFQLPGLPPAGGIALEMVVTDDAGGAAGAGIEIHSMDIGAQSFSGEPIEFAIDGVTAEIVEIPCPADCAAPPDGHVNVADLVSLITHWGAAVECDIAPPGGDGMVNVLDLVALITAWGACP